MASSDRRLDVLVVGGGAREHAFVRCLRKSPRIGRLYCAPGNAGIRDDALVVDIGAEDFPSLVAFVQRERVDLTLIGPEVVLVGGLADQIRERGFAVFGPGADGAMLEGSKSFAKKVMDAAGVATASAALFTEYEAALAYLHEHGAPVVVKADGIAAGKGVIVAHDMAAAEAALRECFLERRFGAAADRVLLEEFLEGEEVSLLSIVSGQQILPLAPAQDYKRAFDDDEGPNTGGMGSYSPVPAVDAALYQKLVDEVVRPTVAELGRRNIDFRGVLYTGLMLTKNGPKVLEFNCRFGDPETEALLPRLESDLLELLWTAATGGELPAAAAWRRGAAVGVVMASRNYPDSPSKGDVISGLERVRRSVDVEVFHAGTKLTDAGIVTSGGRILTVTGLGDSFAEARARAYAAVEQIQFAGERHRSDIALRAEKWEAAAAQAAAAPPPAGGEAAGSAPAGAAAPGTAPQSGAGQAE
jgi:phosphoribosylamine---glycine ligase